MVKHSYEVVPKGWTPQSTTPIDALPFEPFIMDVPAQDHTKVSEGQSARRAYFSAMSLLRNLEPEQWQIFDWTESFGRGPERGPDGAIKAS